MQQISFSSLLKKLTDGTYCIKFRCVYLVRKKEVNFILSYYTNLSHTGQEKFTSFFRTRYMPFRLSVFFDKQFVSHNELEIN